MPCWSRCKDRRKKIDWPLFPALIPEAELESIRVVVSSEPQCEPCPVIREGMIVEGVHSPLRDTDGHLTRKGRGQSSIV